MIKQKPLIEVKDSEYYVQVNEDGSPVTGEIKKVDVIFKEIPRQGFAITYLSSIINMIENLGNKKMQVVKYILQNMDSNNKLSETIREVSKGCGVSLQTVIETLKLLESCGIVARKTGTIMLSPKLVHKGNAQRERYLMAKFSEIKSSEEKD